MKEQIEHFEPRTPSIVAIGTRRIRAFMGDAHPHIGGTLWVGDRPTRVVALAGARRVEAVVYDTAGIEVGDAVRWDPAEAGWPAPRPGATLVSSLAFEPGRSAGRRGDVGDVGVLLTGVELLDQSLPVARHGTTLILDSGAPDACIARILSHCGPIVSAGPTEMSSTYHITGDDGLALATAAQWAAELEGTTLYVESGPTNLDRLADGLNGVTILARISVRDGLEAIAETLELGHSDTQLYLRPDGTIDVARSVSRLVSNVAWDHDIERLAHLREQLQLFGEDELEPEDIELLAEFARLEAGLVV